LSEYILRPEHGLEDGDAQHCFLGTDCSACQQFCEEAAPNSTLLPLEGETMWKRSVSMVTLVNWGMVSVEAAEDDRSGGFKWMANIVVSVQFGLRLPNSGQLAEPNNILTLARLAEQAGYHSVWVHDHILWSAKQAAAHPTIGIPNNKINTNFFESITTLAFLAGATTDIKLGVAAIILPLRQPILLSKQLSCLDVLSSGRLLVGIVPGAPKITISEFEALNVEYGLRGRITDDYLRAVRKIWSENPASYDGQYVRFRDIEMMPKPVRGRIPLLIGGGEKGISEKALRRVIEYGDGWIPAYLTPEELREGILRIKQGFSIKGRPDQPIIVHEMFIAIREQTEIPTSYKNFLQSVFGSDQEGIRRSLIGNTSMIINKLQQYVDTGVDITELKFIAKDVNDMIEIVKIFAREVAPSF
jgi:probable F420-dependent oxidoreductase